jgi:tRNA pseudouridine13 synthase
MQVPADLPTATFRLSPEDFLVEELPAYPPSGQGEHAFVTFRKVGLTTPEAVKRIARALGSDPRDAGHAGMKDRHAITTQTASFQIPLAKDAEAALAAPIEGVTILGVARHNNKLKPGHLLGNRFRIVLRDLDAAAAPGVMAALEAIGKIGVPNAFGPQRFGRDGDNPARAIEWLAGKTRGPRDKREQRLLFSSLQSLWFNQVLGRREADGTWNQILPGDLAKKTDTGGIFLVPLEGPEAEDAVARGKAGSLTPTGPMFGKKMRWPEGAPGAIEREILNAAIGDPARLDAWGHLGEGTRRPLRMEVDELAVAPLGAGDASETPRKEGDPRAREGGVAIAVSFVLPKGGYATTVLGRSVHLVDATISRTVREQTGNPDGSAQDDPAPQEEDAENG